MVFRTGCLFNASRRYAKELLDEHRDYINYLFLRFYWMVLSVIYPRREQKPIDRRSILTYQDPRNLAAISTIGGRGNMGRYFFNEGQLR